MKGKTFTSFIYSYIVLKDAVKLLGNILTLEEFLEQSDNFLHQRG